MSGPGHLRWLRAVCVVGGLYLIVGLATPALANSARSVAARTPWRMAAWAISAVAFATHIAYEQGRLHSSARTTAWHASLSVGLGACGLAIAAWFHARAMSPPHPFPAISIAVWPVMTMLPAFVVALVVTTAISRTRRNM